MWRSSEREDLLWVSNGESWSFNNAMLIMNKIPPEEEPLSYDAKNNSNMWMEYKRIKIRVDVRKPLKRRKKIKGRMVHKCFCRRNIDKRSEEGAKEWGTWLRAAPKREMNQGRNKWLRDEDYTDWEAKIGRSKNCPSITGGNFGDNDKILTMVHDFSNGVKKGKDKEILEREISGTILNPGAGIQDINFGPVLGNEYNTWG
ncbi:hypothetical protein AgCh_021438 [Apium graveolens]